MRCPRRLTIFVRTMEMKMESRAVAAMLSMSVFIFVAPFAAAQQSRIREQTREQKTELPKIVSVKGDGGTAPSPRLRRTHVPEPPPLSDNDKRMLVKSAGIKEDVRPHGAFKLTPARPYLPQASLAFEEPAFFDPNPTSGELTIENQNSFFSFERSNRAVMLFLNVTAGQRYLIDFSVTGGNFFLTDGRHVNETFNGTHHVLLVYEATTNSTPGFYLTGTGRGADVVWRLHSCEVTILN